MDKYEYKLKLEEIQNLMEAKDYAGAVEIADEINWKKVKNATTLCTVGELYEKAGRLEESREILLMAYDRSPVGRNIIYQLTLVAIKMGNLDEAQEYYEEFLEIAPHDNLRYVLKYELAKARGQGLEEQIAILEEFKDREYTEEWAFELALLYHRAGMGERCVETCDELILWFGEGKYVEKALELKMIYQPLNRLQEDKYQRFKQKKDGIVEVSPRDSLMSGEILQDTMKIPNILSDTGKYSTMNLQEELAKGMQQIIDATEPNTVNDTMDSIKKMADDLSYAYRQATGELPPVEEPQWMDEEWEDDAQDGAGLPQEEEPEWIDEEWGDEAQGGTGLPLEGDLQWIDEWGDEAQGEAKPIRDGGLEEIPEPSLDIDFHGMLLEEYDGQISMNIPEAPRQSLQITGQMSIEDILAEWEKAQKAHQIAVEEAGQRELNQAKAKALREAEGIIRQLTEMLPELSQQDWLDIWSKRNVQTSDAMEELTEASIPEPQMAERQRAAQRAEAAAQAMEERKRAAERARAEAEAAEERRRAAEQAQAEAEEEERRKRAEARKQAQGQTVEERWQARRQAAERAQAEAEAAEERRRAIAQAQAEAQAAAEAQARAEAEAQAAVRAAEEAQATAEAQAAALKMQKLQRIARFQDASPQELELEASLSAKKEAPSPQAPAMRKRKKQRDAGREDMELLDAGAEGTGTRKAGPRTAASLQRERQQREAEPQEAGTQAMPEEAANSGLQRANAGMQAEMQRVNDELQQVSLEMQAELQRANAELQRKPQTNPQLERQQRANAELQRANMEMPRRQRAGADAQTRQQQAEPQRAGEQTRQQQAEAQRAGEQMRQQQAEPQRVGEQTRQRRTEAELQHDRLKSQIQRQQAELDKRVQRQQWQASPMEGNAGAPKLDESQKQIFSYFTLIGGMEQQLAQALEGAQARKRGSDDSKAGNLLITGEKGNGKTMLATDFVKAYQQATGKKGGKVGKISASVLNEKDKNELFQALSGGYLIIENAGDLSKETVEQLSWLMEQDTKGMMVILEDGLQGMSAVLSKNRNFAKKFTERIHVPVFTSDELVSFAKAYAWEQNCEIDDMAVLALHESISNIQKPNEPTTLTEVKDIMDDAIYSASRGGLKKLFGAKKSTENGLVLIREKDFKD